MSARIVVLLLLPAYVLSTLVGVLPEGRSGSGTVAAAEGPASPRACCGCKTTPDDSRCCCTPASAGGPLCHVDRDRSETTAEATLERYTLPADCEPLVLQPIFPDFDRFQLPERSLRRPLSDLSLDKVPIEASGTSVPACSV